ncbi:MAG: acetyl-CoA carboxylase biotin carboxylase subunit [Acidobacteria bacterium]|nr:acetyl-CoA carboxylase biotin carboxylase subunit [Acidobacteriota bacterium]MXW37086.1 acetyl-CoA carboxylase biotin carboxylase subunit [Acidobacteriota bacterium]MYA47634.1 acetyl-CoA carboxylase biotin carboxylase subunit [Acidobacteriota bacterium]MYI37619.1 acetyl-CoA carboxylase biotin carboxylase subunit [Acidobacteriota bacterium]
MLGKVLVANRGEIAVRIIAACRDLGLRTVIAYSDADRDALPVRLADERVCIGPASARESYLDVPRILTAAQISGADAIHPGYGFLAESHALAEVCEACRVTFIGPPPESIRSMGDKALARRIMQEAGVPILPGTESGVSGVDEATRVAAQVGYPVLLKASFGGGGRGMRIVGSEAELAPALASAAAEAQAAFGDAEVYIERYLPSVRHVEVQVFADAHGNTVHLGERDCSVQRRHQKLVEEAPGPGLTDATRAKLGAAAVKAAEAVGYRNAGTVEFLMDPDGNFFFSEMNVRIQVEHPVTEMVTGVDLVREQIQVAAGEPLSFSQESVRVSGAAIECRINAEDPERFIPSPGTITAFHSPGGPGVRVDTAAHAGAVIPPYYDSLVAKLIVHGEDRMHAVARMRRALAEMEVEGIHTTLPLHRRIMASEEFLAGGFDTGFIGRLG